MSDLYDIIPGDEDLEPGDADLDLDQVDAGAGSVDDAGLDATDEPIDAQAFAAELTELQRSAPGGERLAEMLGQMDEDPELAGAVRAHGWSPLTSVDPSGFEFDPELSMAETIRRYVDIETTVRLNGIQLDAEAQAAVDAAVDASAYGKQVPARYRKAEPLQRAEHLLKSAFSEWASAQPFPIGQTRTHSYTGPDGLPHVELIEQGGLRRTRELSADQYPQGVFNVRPVELTEDLTYEDLGAMTVPELARYKRMFPEKWDALKARASDEMDLMGPRRS